MKEFLFRLVDLIAAIFGDGQMPRSAPTRPLELPPPPPPPVLSDPNEPQDSGDLTSDTPVVISHEEEESNGGDQPEFEDNPAPPPSEDITGEEEVTEAPPLPTPPHPDHQARYMWCLDPGHGSLTVGKRSPVMPNGARFYEYEFNRDIVSRISSQLDVLGIRYFITVPEVNVGNFLEQRVERANKLSTALPKIFLSIHANAGPAPSMDAYTEDNIRGIETWYFHRSSKGRKIAAVFQKKLIEQTGFQNRHLRSRVTGQFYVLRATKMPAILTENGFYNNRLEVLELQRNEVRQKIADAHVLAIRQIEKNGI